LIIQAEYLDPEENIKEIITDSLYDIITYGSFTIEKELCDYFNNKEISKLVPKEYRKISRDFIKNNLSSFIYNVKNMEIFFDMKSSSISMQEDVIVFDTLDPDYKDRLKEFQKTKQYLTKNAIIVHKGTIYTRDYHRGVNDSTGKLYYRKDKLLTFNNAYSKKIIEDYPYDRRIEFLLTNRNTGYRLNLFNLDCNSREILNKYSAYLKIYFTKYYRGVISFFNIDHLPVFQNIVFYGTYYPKKRYADKILIKCKRKYAKRLREIDIKLLGFKDLLKKEYRRIEKEYLHNIALMKSIFKYYAIPIEYHTPYCIYNTDTSEEYAKITLNDDTLFGKYWFTPIGPIVIDNIYI
jgi:hypothetical protein